MEEKIQFNSGYQSSEGNNYSCYHSAADDNDDQQVSDCESCTSSVDDKDDDQSSEGLFDEGFIRLDEEEIVHKAVKHKFLSSLGDLAKNMTVVEMHKKNWPKFRAYDAAKVFRHIWYGGSKEEVARIMSHGFDDHHEIYNKDGLYGKGHPAQSVQTCVMDDNGLRHVLLCRVILEIRKLEVDPKFDDDGVVAQNKLGKMKSRILPEYVISFSAPSCLFEEYTTTKHVLMKKPNSPWMSFTTLFSMLPKFLPQPTVDLINKYHNDHNKGKISRCEFVKKLRLLAGDDLLMRIIKSSVAI